MPSSMNSQGVPGRTDPSGGAFADQRVGNVRKQATADLVGRMPPFNEEAEQAVLASMMHYEDMRDEIAIKISASDFHVPRHAVIYQACWELYRDKSPIEPRSLAEKLAGAKQLEEAGGAEYLNEIWNQEVLGANGVFYARMVSSKSMQRQLINACARIMTDVYDTPWDQTEQMLDDAERSIFSIAEKTASSEDLVCVRDARNAFFERLDKQSKSSETVTGVTTGYPDLDKRTSGLQPSDLIIIAARPSMGKTAFALNLALNAASVGKKVAFFSLEMSTQQLESRLISICSRVSLSKLRQPNFLNDDDWRALYHAADRLDCDLYVDDTPGIRTLDLRAKCRRMKSRIGLDMVFVDYMQLMHASSRNIQSRELEISEISRSLKALAKELDIPVVALAQLNRKLEDRDDKRPILSDLRESGAIEQDADVIMFIYRDDVYRKKGEGERLMDSPADIIIGKQRNGPVGTVRLLYKCAYTSFVSMTSDYQAEPSEDGGTQ